MADRIARMSAISSSTSCKILTISSELSHAQHLVHRVSSLPSQRISVPLTANRHRIRRFTPSGIIRFAANETAADIGPAATSAVQESSGSTAPWRISNKYYTADVHFESMSIDQYLHRRNEFDGVPAVLFAWIRGQVRRQSSLSPISLLITHHIRCTFRFLDGIAVQRTFREVQCGDQLAGSGD